MAMAKLALVTGFLAAATIAAASPSLPVTANSTVASHKSAFFGNKNGNFQGDHHTFNLTSSYPHKNSTGPNSPGSRKRDTGEWVQIPVDAVWESDNYDDGIGAGSDSYTMYWGDGGSWDGWPTRANWVSFSDMFNANFPLMQSSCDWYGVNDDTADEALAIYDSIQAVADDTGVDHRVILAVIMQESGGCVRVPTTNYGVRNPGLMQSHDGPGTCNSDLTGEVNWPCSYTTITQMVMDGTAGTESGDGLANCINESGWYDDADFYRAARIYNSGAVNSSGNLECGIATHCYASDIANRLTGWVYADHGCHCDDYEGACGC